MAEQIKNNTLGLIPFVTWLRPRRGFILLGLDHTYLSIALSQALSLRQLSKWPLDSTSQKTESTSLSFHIKIEVFRKVMGSSDLLSFKIDLEPPPSAFFS